MSQSITQRSRRAFGAKLMTAVAALSLPGVAQAAPVHRDGMMRRFKEDFASLTPQRQVWVMSFAAVAAGRPLDEDLMRADRKAGAR